MSVAMLGEFELISRYFSNIRFADSSITLGTGDDCAGLSLKQDQELLFSIDTFIEGVHFPAAAKAEWVAQRCLRAAISDLAAMGASPLCFTLALTLPRADETWLDGFATGLRAAAHDFRCSLVGGNTCKGHLSATLQVHGTIEKNKSLRRTGAQHDDCILVSGFLGGAAAYVQMLNKVQDDSVYRHARELFEQDYYFPSPCIALGQAIRHSAHSAIDLSDGLLADLHHLCTGSALSARLQVDQLPMRPELRQQFSQTQAQGLALCGGDDYQLLFTAPENQVRNLMKISEALEVPLTVIGKMTKTHSGTSHAVACYDGEHIFDASIFPSSGYRHF